jgi:hypothetical protein
LTFFKKYAKIRDNGLVFFWQKSLDSQKLLFPLDAACVLKFTTVPTSSCHPTPRHLSFLMVPVWYSCHPMGACLRIKSALRKAAQRQIEIIDDNL